MLSVLKKIRCLESVGGVLRVFINSVSARTRGGHGGKECIWESRCGTRWRARTSLAWAGGGGKLIVLCLLGALLTVQEGVKAGMICEMRFYLFLPLQQLPTLYFV